MAFDVFISYSSKDKVAADATCATLEAAGIRCWVAPRDIMPGSEYGAAIIDALDRCRVVVLVFSSSANKSPQIHREIERAVSRGVPIIPLRIEDTTPTESMAYFMESVHWLDAMNPPLESHLHRLVESLKSLLPMDSKTEPVAVADRLTPSGPPFLSHEADLHLQVTANTATTPESPVSGRSSTKVAMRFIAITAIVLFVGYGAICFYATIDILRTSEDTNTIVGLVVMEVMAFVIAYFIYEFGVRRPSLIRK